MPWFNETPNFLGIFKYLENFILTLISFTNIYNDIIFKFLVQNLIPIEPEQPENF